MQRVLENVVIYRAQRDETTPTLLAQWIAVVHRLSAWDGLPLRRARMARRQCRLAAALPARAGAHSAATLQRWRTLSARAGVSSRRTMPAAAPPAGRATSARYAPEACLRDVLDICAALHLHQVDRDRHQLRRAARRWGWRPARPSLLRGVVLNDIGPDIGSDGADFVRRFVGDDIGFADLDACVAHLRALLPPLSLDGDAAWRTMAALTYAPGNDGMLRPVWDTRIAGLLNGGTPDLWPLFGALAHVPLLLVRGEASDILLPATVARMQATRPDMAVVSLPGIGHAPTLAEPEIVAALQAFLDDLM